MDYEDKEMLERFIDKYDVNAVLAEMAEICAAKAEHIAHNWQDTTLAGKWMRRAKTIGEVRL